METYPHTPRSTCLEDMDAPHPAMTLLRQEFRVLRRLNRMTGAADKLVRSIESRLKPERGDSILMVDFGAGVGDIAQSAIRTARAHGWRLEVIATDRNRETVELGRSEVTEECISFLHADILDHSGTIAPKSADVAHASLMLHHLRDDKVVTALRSMATVARKLLIWNDLIRSPMGVFGARLITLGFPRPVRDDASLSVRRAFTTSEAEAFAEAAGLTNISFVQHRGPRFLLCARPPAESNAPTSRPLIRCENVSFGYDSRRVLDNFSTVVRSGEIGIIRGANGSGKSTLFRILAGALRPDSGRAWCDRSAVATAYLPQLGGLMTSTDLASNIELSQVISGTVKAERGERGRDASAQFGMTSFLSTPISRLSVGQTKRAALSVAFALGSRVLLLDEPEAALDSDGRLRLVDAITRQTNSGAAVLLATHDIEWMREVTNDRSRTCIETVLA